MLPIEFDQDTGPEAGLFEQIYDQLRAAAQKGLNSERQGHTLTATALVHEAYLRLVGPREIPWAGRAHFYAAAAQAMRRILLDHARSRARRGKTIPISDISDAIALSSADSQQILAVDDAVQRLESEDAEAAALVRLRFYAGLSVEQAAAALGISPRTAARLWNYARAVLFQRLNNEP